jgi:hypothetical protein
MYLNPITVIAREDKPGRIRLEVSERRFRISTHHYMFGEHENPQSDIDNTAKIDKGHQKTENEDLRTSRCTRTRLQRSRHKLSKFSSRAMEKHPSFPRETLRIVAYTLMRQAYRSKESLRKQIGQYEMKQKQIHDTEGGVLRSTARIRSTRYEQAARWMQ